MGTAKIPTYVGQGPPAERYRVGQICENSPKTGDLARRGRPDFTCLHFSLEKPFRPIPPFRDISDTSASSMDAPEMHARPGPAFVASLASVSRGQAGSLATTPLRSLQCSRRSLVVRRARFPAALPRSEPSSQQNPCEPARASVGGLAPRIGRIIDVLTALFPIWVASGALLAYVYPPALLWFSSSYIVPVLALIMLGMGLTIAPSAFWAIASTPWQIFLGAAAQYGVMPLLARFLARAFALPPPLAAGLVLVGVCPGGAASNLVCLIAQADVALSVVLTLVSTLLSVALVPLLMQVLAGALVPVSPLGLFVSTAQVVIAPLVAGALLKRAFPMAVDKVVRVLPLISVIGVTLICGGVVAGSAGLLTAVGPRLVAAVACLHAAGGVLGYAIALAFRLPVKSARTVSIEVMMQNSSLAVSLANTHFANPLTAIPGAISATMHSIFGSFLAGAWRLMDRWQERREIEETGFDPPMKEAEAYRIIEE